MQRINAFVKPKANTILSDGGVTPFKVTQEVVMTHQQSENLFAVLLM